MWRATASFIVVVVAAIAAMPVASATTLTWPGSPGCTGTLQACVDASGSGDTIEIATNTPVDEDIELGNHSLSLTSARYHDASLAAGRSIGAHATSPADLAVSISNLRLRDGRVMLANGGGANATYDLRELDLSQSAGGVSPALQVSATSGTVNATLYHNRVAGAPANINAGLIEIASFGATINAYAEFNTLVRTDRASSDGAGIFVSVVSGVTAGAGYFAAFGNEVRGAFNRGGIFFSEGLGSTTPSTFAARAYANAITCPAPEGQGIGFVANSGSIDLQAINNTVSGCAIGVSALLWEGATTGSFSGPVWNNVLVADSGLMFTPSATGAVTNDYNLVNASSNSATLGPHTITAPAALSASAPPRLSASSPAIDAADGATLAFGLIDNGFPVLDADGLRRLKLSGADIGAYEYGDVTF